MKLALIIKFISICCSYILFTAWFIHGGAERLLRFLFIGLCTLVVFLLGCSNLGSPWEYPHQDDVTERFISRWESVDNMPVSRDFRGALEWNFVAGGTFEGPCAGREVDGCVYWDVDAWTYHIYIRTGMPPKVTRDVMYHELGHAALYHHYGDIDPHHERAEWKSVVQWLKDN